MEAAKAGLPARCVSSCNPAMVESPEGAGMCSCGCVRDAGHMKPSVKTTPMGTGGMIDVRSIRMKVIPVDDRSTVRDERIVVVNDPTATAPVESPIAPTPAEAAK